jgi:uncharacterized protein YcaQ
MRLVPPDEARRIAIRSQQLDGTAEGVLETVRRLARLQLDPIATVAPAQHLVLWSRLGAYDMAELDRLLWQTRELFEWNAFIWPIEDLPLVRALMRRQRRSTRYARDRWMRNFLAENRSFRRYVLREIEQRGPLPSRELEDRAAGEPRDHRWYGSRRVGLMLMTLHQWGELAVAGRQGNQRLWDLAERWYPEAATVPARTADAALAEKRFRALGVRQRGDGWEAHSDATDGAIPARATFLSPFDRLVHDRARAEALFDFFYRIEIYVPPAKREFGYYVLPILHGDRLVGRIEPVFDRKERVLRVAGLWAQPNASADDGPAIAAALERLGSWLDAEETRYEAPTPAPWAETLPT